MRIGVDLDGVCYDFKLAMSEWLTNGLLMPGCRLHEANNDWHFYEGWGLDHESFLHFYEAGVDAGQVLWRGKMLDNAARWINLLRSVGHSIHIVTDRSVGTEARQATLSWLNQVGITFDSIDFTADKTSVDVDAFIDDKLENYDALRAVGVQCYLVNRPWNQVQPWIIDTRQRVASIGEFAYKFLPMGTTLPEETDVPTQGPKQTSTEVRVVNDTTGGEKGQKLARFDLIPARPMWLVAEHYGRGAEKYEDRNWERGYDWKLSIGAMKRHMNLFEQGEDLDTEEGPMNGSPHMAAIIFHALALLEFAETHPELDDRPKRK